MPRCRSGWCSSRRTPGTTPGYDYGQNHILGFSADHLNGVGCGLGGDLPVLPTTGDITSTDDAAYAASFSHADESASPGYYKVKLGSGITAELTASTRTGRQRYTFPATDKANVMLDSGQALHKVTSSTVTVLDDRTVLTSITGSGFCQDTKPYTLYTETRFNRPFLSYGTWNGATVTAGSRTSTSTGLGGAYVRFDTTKDHDVEAVTALSWTGAAGAAENLAAEGRGTFDAARDAATAGVAGPARADPGAGRHRRAAGDVLLLAVPLLPRPQRRRRRRRPLHRLGRQGAPRGRHHLLPELVPVGHLPHAGAAAVPAGAARVPGHGAVAAAGRRRERPAAALGLRHGRDEHHDRRPGHAVPGRRLPAGAAQGPRGGGVPGAEEPRGPRRPRVLAVRRPAGRPGVPGRRLRAVRPDPAADQAR